MSYWDTLGVTSIPSEEGGGPHAYITRYFNIQYEKNTKTFSQKNEKDQKQNEKDKKIFSFANNLKTMHLDKYPETGT